MTTFLQIFSSIMGIIFMFISLFCFAIKNDFQEAIYYLLWCVFMHQIEMGIK